MARHASYSLPVIQKDGYTYINLARYCDLHEISRGSIYTFNSTINKIPVEKRKLKHKMLKERILLQNGVVYLREDYIDIKRGIPYKKELEDYYWYITETKGIKLSEICKNILPLIDETARSNQIYRDEKAKLWAIYNYIWTFSLSNGDYNKKLVEALKEIYGEIKGV